MKRILGFTLTELLVVIGIVILLAAIALPVFFLVRRQSQRATCQSNLRQVYLALHQYVDDNDGTWPSNESWDNVTFTSVRLGGCPQTVPVSRSVRHAGIDGYAYNTAFKKSDGRHDVGLDSPDIRFPTTTVVVCEEAIGHSYTYGPNPYHNTTQIPVQGEEKGWIRHNGGANYLFADGHVKWHLLDTVGYNDEKGNNGTFPTFSVGMPEK